jgi:hypothetical protein
MFWSKLSQNKVITSHWISLSPMKLPAAMMPGPIKLSVDTNISSDKRNYGLINSVFAQTFNHGPSLATAMFVIICAILIIGALFTHALLRQVTQNGRTISVHNQQLALLAARHQRSQQARGQVE